MPILYNLEWDPREEHEVDFPHGWVVHPMAAAAGAFLKTLVIEPPIKPGTPDPYLPPKPGELRPEEHLQIGVITQYVTSLTKTHDRAATAAPWTRPSDWMRSADMATGEIELMNLNAATACPLSSGQAELASSLENGQEVPSPAPLRRPKKASM